MLQGQAATRERRERWRGVGMRIEEEYPYAVLQVQCVLKPHVAIACKLGCLLPSHTCLGGRATSNCAIGLTCGCGGDHSRR